MPLVPFVAFWLHSLRSFQWPLRHGRNGSTSTGPERRMNSESDGRGVGPADPNEAWIKPYLRPYVCKRSIRWRSLDMRSMRSVTAGNMTGPLCSKRCQTCVGSTIQGQVGGDEAGSAAKTSCLGSKVDHVFECRPKSPR